MNDMFVHMSSDIISTSYPLRSSLSESTKMQLYKKVFPDFDPDRPAVRGFGKATMASDIEKCCGRCLLHIVPAIASTTSNNFDFA